MQTSLASATGVSPWVSTVAAKCFQQEVAVFVVRSRSKASSLNPLAYRSAAKSIRKHIGPRQGDVRVVTLATQSCYAPGSVSYATFADESFVWHLRSVESAFDAR